MEVSDTGIEAGRLAETRRDRGLANSLDHRGESSSREDETDEDVVEGLGVKGEIEDVPLPELHVG